MTQARYVKTLSLTPEENMLVDFLRGEKIPLKRIFEAGLEFYAPKVPREVLEKAKKLVQ